MFTDAQYMTAKDKETVLKHWKKFIINSFQRKDFTKQLYNHLIQHCGYIAHFNMEGFYSVYFSSPLGTKTFVEDFSVGGEYKYIQGERWLPDYKDIGEKMDEFLEIHKGRIKLRCAKEICENDLEIARNILKKYNIEPTF